MAAELPTLGELEAQVGRGPDSSAQPWPKPRVAWYAVGVFALVLMFGQLDQGVITLLIRDIKADFMLSDQMIGLLTGLAPSLFFVVIGIPLSLLVDTGTRKYVLAAGIGVCSVMTTLCGLAQSFWQLFVVRVFVGGGTAVNGPGSYSMLSDFFPRPKLAAPFYTLQIGFILGTGLPLILGAYALNRLAAVPVQHWGPLVIHHWQMVFIAVGVPALLGALLLLTVPEPARRGLAQKDVQKATPMSLVRTVGYLFGHWRLYGPMFLGLAFSALETYGTAVWRVPFLQRTYHWGNEAGYVVGVTTIVFQCLGLIVGSAFTAWMSKRYDDANVRVVAICYTLTPIFAVAGPLMPNPWAAVICAGLTGLFGLAGAAPQNAAIQSVTPNQMRGQVTALYLFVFTVIGQGLGPNFISFFTDVVIGDESKLRLSMAVTAAFMTPIAAIIIWLGVKPYGKAIAEIKAREAAGQA
jgi:MFS family permease